MDVLLGLSLPQGPEPARESSAVELLITTLSGSPNVSLLALGPLTNVAEALQASPALAGALEMIYIMGGAVDVPGNAPSPEAEWNIYVDPHAARLVFESGAPITLIPLDATNDAAVSSAFVRRLRGARTSPEASFVFEVLSRQNDFIESGSYYFWDPLAAAILSDEGLASLETRKLTVVEAGAGIGATRASESGAALRVAVSANRERFEQVFLDTLNAP